MLVWPHEADDHLEKVNVHYEEPVRAAKQSRVIQRRDQLSNLVSFELYLLNDTDTDEG